MDLSTPLGIDCTISLRSIPLNHTWCSQCQSPVRHSTCSFKLICASPGFAVLTRPPSRLPQFVPDTFLAPRPDLTKKRPRRVTPSESARLLCCVNPSRPSGHEFVRRFIPLHSGCLFVSKQTFTTYSTCRQSTTTYFTCRQSITMFLSCFRLRSPFLQPQGR